MKARCNICGREYSLDLHIAHIVGRHWDYLMALHAKPDLIPLLEKNDA